VLNEIESIYTFPKQSTCYINSNNNSNNNSGNNSRTKSSRTVAKTNGTNTNTKSTMYCADSTKEGCLSSFRSLLTEDGYIHECRRCFDKVSVLCSVLYTV